MIYPEEKTLILGGSSSVGKELQKILPKCMYVSSKDYDLTDNNQVENMYKELKPLVVVNLSAKVGGIMSNMDEPVEYLEENILMNTLATKYAHKYNVQFYLGILSTCIYAENQHHASYPLSESILFEGNPPKGNLGYGLAKKIAGQTIELYNKQYGKNWSYLIPCNLYTEHSDFNLETSHFVNALVKKIYDAEKNDSNHIILFGDGKPRRQFIDSSDLAKVIALYLENDYRIPMNVVDDTNYSIDEMAKIALKTLNLEHKIEVRYNSNLPSGQMRKDASNARFKQYFRDFQFQKLEDGILKLYSKLKEEND